MSAVSTWSTVAANNNSAPPDGWPESMAPSNVNDSAREMMAAIRTFFNDTQNSANHLIGSVAGTNTITGSLPVAPAAYAAGQLFTFEPAANNTGAATININSLGAKSIVKYDGDTLVAGDLVANVPAVIVYDGTQFFLINPQVLAGNITESQITDGTILARVAANETISGNYTFSGAPTFSGTVHVGSISANLDANQDDWAPTGIATATVVRVTASASYNVNSISASQSDGRLLWIVNVGTNAFSFPENSTGTAANRIHTGYGTSRSIGAKTAALLRYDGTLSRWMVIGSSKDSGV